MKLENIVIGFFIFCLLVYIYFLQKRIKKLKEKLKNSNPIDFLENVRNEVLNYDYTKETPKIVKLFSKAKIRT